MPDPMEPAIAFYYIDDDVTMNSLCSFLVLTKHSWFDARRCQGHRWSICFSAIIQPPKHLSKKLIAVEPTAAGIIQANVAVYKAKRAAELHGSKRR